MLEDEIGQTSCELHRTIRVAAVVVAAAMVSVEIDSAAIYVWLKSGRID